MAETNKSKYDFTTTVTVASSAAAGGLIGLAAGAATGAFLGMTVLSYFGVLNCTTIFGSTVGASYFVGSGYLADHFAKKNKQYRSAIPPEEQEGCPTQTLSTPSTQDNTSYGTFKSEDKNTTTPQDDGKDIDGSEQTPKEEGFSTLVSSQKYNNPSDLQYFHHNAISTNLQSFIRN